MFKKRNTQAKNRVPVSNTEEKMTQLAVKELRSDPALVARLGLPPSIFMGSKPVEKQQGESSSGESSVTKTGKGSSRISGIWGIILSLIGFASLALIAFWGFQLSQSIVDDQIIQLVIQMDVVEGRLVDLRQRMETSYDISVSPEETVFVPEKGLVGNDLVRWLGKRVDYLEREVSQLEEQITLQSGTGDSQYAIESTETAPLSPVLYETFASDRINQQIIDLRRHLLDLKWRLYRLEQHFSQEEPLPSPGSILVSAGFQELRADGQMSMPIRIQLHDASGQPDGTSQSVSVSIVEGGGELGYGELRDQQIDLMTDESGEAVVTYYAGIEPGPVVVIVYAHSGDREEGRFEFDLIEVPPPHSLGVSLNPDVLQVGSEEQATMTIQVFSEGEQLLPGATEVNVSATPDHVVIIDPPSPLMTQDGAVTVTVRPAEGLRKAFDVTFDITTVGSVSETVILHLELPPLPMCRVTAPIGVFVTKEIDESNTGKAFDLPPGTEVGCPNSLSETPVPVVVTFWISTDSVDNGVLIHTNTVQLSLHPEGPLEEEPQVTLWSFSSGAPVQPTGREEVDGYIQVRLHGWATPPSSLDLIEQ
ncbi:hypothetical protein GF406_10320 [candidate division KSB1 bacterium]|nr:hypothetical protein [candidate division KSB1 bacterium]